MHLEQVVVLQVLGRRDEDDLTQARAFEASVQADQTFVTAARPANEDLLAGEVVQAADPTRTRMNRRLII
jgi:hypothetical protein